MLNIFFSRCKKALQINGYVLIILLSIFFTSQSWAVFVDPEAKIESSVSPLDKLDSFKLDQPPVTYDDKFENFSLFKSTADNVRDLYKSGLKHLRLGNKDQGIKDLQKAWELAPNQIPTAVALSDVYLKDKKAENALEIGKKLQEAQPNMPHGYNIEGFAYQSLGDKKKSIEAFNQALKVSKGEPSASAALAEYALMDKDVNRARALYIDAIKYNPHHLRTLFLLAGLDSSLGDTKQVEGLIEDAHEKSPDDVLTHNHFAQIYEALRKYPQALEEIDKALKLEPNNPHSLFAKARLLAGDGQFDAARAILKNLSATYPKSVTSRELEGRIALEQNKPEEAIILFQEALKLQDDPLLAVQMAFAQIRAGKIESGFETFRTLIKRSPSDVKLRALFAEQLRRHNSLDEAVKQYEEIIRQVPDNAGVHNNLAWVLGQKGEIDSGLQHAKQALDKAPKDPNVMDTYAELLLKKGQYEKAEALLLKAAEISPKNLGIRFHLSQAFIGLNKNEQAKKLLNELLDQDAPFVERQQAEAMAKDLGAR